MIRIPDSDKVYRIRCSPKDGPAEPEKSFPIWLAVLWALILVPFLRASMTVFCLQRAVAEPMVLVAGDSAGRSLLAASPCPEKTPDDASRASHRRRRWCREELG